MSSAEVIQDEEPNAWWTTLRHDGVLLSPPVLEETFPDGPPSVPEQEIDRLRRQYKRFKNNPERLRDWLNLVFEEFLGLQSGWEKETFVSPKHRHQDLSPHRVLTDDEDEPRLAVWIDDDRVTNDDGEPGRIGIYSGRRTYADLVKLLRNTDIPIGILTNGHQFRIVYATLDRECWAEWEAEAWFEGGQGRDALSGFYRLLNDEILSQASEEDEYPLLQKIKESRERQADLSDVMGTQVRESVEMLLQELDSVLMEVDEETREEILTPLKERDINRQEELRARYQASIRIIMRLVVALYAESRELFPKENPVYYDSYSVEGLFRELREAKIEESEEALEKQYGAWPRLQSLSRLIYHGSPHPDIPMQSYGGRLFRPPSEDGEDDVLAGIEVFEHDEVRITDATILEILENLKIAEFRSGGSRRRGPVDFSELRTEYIGMMYEGLLDYDLREATEDDGAIVFLNIGDEPALPFNVLKNLDDDGLENLVDNLKDESSGSFLADEEVSEEDFDEEELEADEEDDATDEDQQEETPEDIEARVHQWAKRVVEETGVYMPHHNTVRAMDPTIQEKYEDKAAKRLVDRIIRPGGTYLVSWEGTRKSTGTFYTPPGLAVPTVQRTLEPQVYNTTEGGEIVPKHPGEILDLQICDPAMGSGTFPVAAIRYLTEGLKQSFEEYVFPEVDEGEPIAAPLGEEAKGILNERLLSIRVGEDEEWEQRLELQLKRAVVERCIYGVDINPLAVDLGKLSIWIETMDPELPFTFLDHKLRVGNSLIGAWLDEFQHYPVAAWDREGANDVRDKRIRSFRTNELKDQMRNYIKQSQYQTHWFETGSDIGGLIESARRTFESLHDSVDEYERERVYQEEFRENEDIQTLRHLLDRWCAIWFWPMDTEDTPILDPDTFYNSVYDSETDPIVSELANRDKLRFFHWELEFPDVFSGEERGFDAIVGNPPWEILNPNPDEFFTQYRPEFRTYNKQKSEEIKDSLFEENPHIEKEWHRYVEFYRGFSNYVKNSNDPWDVPLGRGKKAEKLSESWREIRENKQGEKNTVGQLFTRQGSGHLNTYKLFTEKSYKIVNNGRLGLLTPSGLYLDYGSSELRRMLLKNNWEWLYTFHNKNKIFDIPSQEKFAVNIVDQTENNPVIKCYFNETKVSNWNTSKIPDHLKMSREQIERFSPENLIIFEIPTQKDVDIMNTIYENSVTVKQSDFDYTSELNTSSDSGLFIPNHKVTNPTRKSDVIWESEDDEEYLSLIQGRMIHQFDPVYQSYLNQDDGKRDWKRPSTKQEWLVPKYFISMDDYASNDKIVKDIKITYRRTSQPLINPRSMTSAVIPPVPTADSVFILEPPESGVDTLATVGLLNSYVFDYVLRFRIPGINLSKFIVNECPIAELDEDIRFKLAKKTAQLNWVPDIFPPIEEYTSGQITDIDFVSGDENRAKIREEIDRLSAIAYGFEEEDMEWILRPDNPDERTLWKDYKKRLVTLGGEGNWGQIEESQIAQGEDL